MAVNTDPIYLITPILSFAKIPAAQTIVASNGVAANTLTANTLITVCQFGAFGGWLERITVRGVGSAATSMVAQPNIIRVFLGTTAIINNTATTVNNTKLFLEHYIGLTTIPVSNATTAGTYDVDIPVDIPISANMYIHVAQTAIMTVNTQWQIGVRGGNF